LARTVRRNLRRNLLPSVAATWLAIVVIGALAVWVHPGGLTHIDLNQRNHAPVTGGPHGGFPHLLGTDPLGRDELGQLLIGARISLAVCIASVLVSGAIGVTLGLLAGYFRGWIDDVVMRLVDLQMSVPSLLIALLVLFVLGSSLLNVILVLSVTRWMVYARVTRSMTLSLREEPFTDASRTLGASSGRILIRHILPNVASPLLVLATLEMALMLLAEASLDFLGLGVQAPLTSWGLMLSNGQEYISSAWWLITFPGLIILLTTLSINVIATSLRKRSAAPSRNPEIPPDESAPAIAVTGANRKSC
jgi:peptide/nickel transport system permease protein